MQAAGRRTALAAPPLQRAFDPRLSHAERRAAVEEVAVIRHVHPGGRWHAHSGGGRAHEHRKP